MVVDSRWAWTSKKVVRRLLRVTHSFPVMDTTQPPRRFPKFKFRVLIIGRANAGKTSILQRVCDTTESPVVNRRMGSDWTDSDNERIQLDQSTERGEHRIEDEIIFSNHDGYIFHDSRGFESGGADELNIVQNFIQQKSGESRLVDRLHAIWYCIPMDDFRPELDMKYFKDICPDPNVPVIGVFTKYDQFKLDVEMDLEDGDTIDEQETPETRFDKYYLCHLGGARFVQLERMHQPDGCCKNLIEETAQALKDDVVALMLLAVQRSNLQLSVMLAVNHMCPKLRVSNAKEIVKICLSRFPYIWIDLLDDPPDMPDDDFVTFIMSMSIVKQFSSGSSGYHLMTAFILILRHATTLHLSGLRSQSSLTQAELDLQKLNIVSKITQKFSAPPQQYSVPNYVDFIMGVSV